MKSYEALKVEEFIASLVNRGSHKCFVVFKDEAGDTKNLVFENKELFVTDGKRLEIWKPYPEMMYRLLSGLKNGNYPIIGYGEIKVPENKNSVENLTA